jgi:hypothetical protein
MYRYSELVRTLYYKDKNMAATTPAKTPHTEPNKRFPAPVPPLAVGVAVDCVEDGALVDVEDGPVDPDVPPEPVLFAVTNCGRSRFASTICKAEICWPRPVNAVFWDGSHEKLQKVSFALLPLHFFAADVADFWILGVTEVFRYGANVAISPRARASTDL